jgi:hypothetical protein
LTIVAFLTAGWVAGQLLDTILWHISWDYVYRPEQFTEAAVRWSLLMGTIAAATATVGAHPSAGHGSVARALTLVCVATAAGAALLAATGTALVQWELIQTSGVTLIPPARVWFCEGLWRGAAAGALVGTVFGSWNLWKARERKTEE